MKEVMCTYVLNTKRKSSVSRNRIAVQKSEVPQGFKYAFTAFMLVLVPSYWYSYGPTNFLYFCDTALFLTLLAVWRNSALAASVAAVGILIPQFFWCIDFACEFLGFHLSHMTAYMFNEQYPLYLRGLSLFHGWLPFALVYLVSRMGYDKRAFAVWSTFSVILCLIAYFLLPEAGAVLADPNTPRNVNYVYGLNDAAAQTVLNPHLYLVCWIIGLTTFIYLPTHLLLKKFVKPTA